MRTTVKLPYLLAVAAFVAMALAAAGQTVPPAPVPPSKPDPALTVSGVGLGTELVAVRKALGAAQQETDDARQADADSDMGPGKTLQYDGLTVELCKPAGKPDFHVWRMVATSPERKFASGIAVGMTRDVAVALLGTPLATSHDDQGVELLSYPFHAFAGSYWLRVKDGVVIEVGMAEDFS